MNKMVEVFVGFAHDYSSSDEGAEEKEEMVVFGPGYEVRRMGMNGYDRVMRKGRIALWEEVGWEKWFLLGELVQGCV
jgi:hypothetical protein